MTKFWNEKAETMSRDELAACQLARLRKTVEHCYGHGPFYRAKMDQAGVKPADIRSLDDLRRLPFIDKEDFRLQYPLGMLCADRASLREMHMSSGSTGTPVVMAYTEHDLDQWAECMARCYTMAGVHPTDAIQITPGFGLFNGGFGFYHGARKAGLFVIPAGAGNTPRQIKLMKDFGVRALMGVVSYGVRILEVLQEQ